MDTIPEPFSLRNDQPQMPSVRRGFRVPFGLRDGRVWAPGEVAKGKGCGCVCPGCGQPLIAKALTSRHRRPHFAHLAVTDCPTGRESGIHKRAKQVILERRELLLPDWNGDLFDRINPPRAQDDEGQFHEGRRIEWPPVRVALRDLEKERSFGGYQPDVVAHDDVGELLIEIRVTHAVDDCKAARVQAHDRRMVEIDLSHMDRDTPHDAAAFDEAVLFDVSNRTWISCPEAVAQWQEAKDELEQQVAERNASLAARRDAAVRAAKARAEAEQREKKDKAGRRAFIRTRERSKYGADLARLSELTAPERVASLLRGYQASAEGRVSELLDAACPAARSACLRAHADAWVFGIDPVLWQLLAFDRFVGQAHPGDRFNQRDVAKWVRRSFPHERPLYRLFVAQYAQRADARRAGFNKWRLHSWVFTDEENALIPNFYAPVNDFIDRLVGVGLIRKLPAPVGECEVVGAPGVFHRGRFRSHT